MSYILDALRKADAERRGVTAPAGLNEPAVLLNPNDPDPDLPPATAKPWAWVLGGVGLALVAAVGWHLLRGDGVAPVAAPVAVSPPPTPVVAAPMPEPVPPPAPSADALPNFPPPLPTPAPPPPKPEARAAAPAPSPLPADKPADKPALPPGIGVVAPAPAVPAAERVYNVTELPEAVRRDFPKLSVGGAMYSDRAADRMVVLNGQVFHEGDALGKDLKLRQIKLKSAVLEFRGYRVEIGY